MKRSLTTAQKVEVRVECLRLALRKAEQHNGQSNATRIIQDAEKMTEFVLGEG